MASRSGEMQALESDAPEGLLGGMSLPLGMTRRGLSYDDALEAPMSPPPPDINVNILWKRPVIPERKFQRLAEEDEPGGSLAQGSCSDPAAAGVASQPPVVKAKASSIIMNSLMTKQTQESMQRFEMQAGLTDAGYTPHKGLAAEEARYHRMAESLHKLKVQESKEERQTSSAQSTPNTTPQSSPRPKRRGWFSQGSIPAEFVSTNPTAVGGGVGSEAGAVDRWSVFGPRPAVHKSTTDPGGFALQAYRGAQKPTPMEVMKAQVTRLAEDPASLQPPRLDIPGMEARRQLPRSHNLKPRDLNVLTPSGF